MLNWLVAGWLKSGRKVTLCQLQLCIKLAGGWLAHVFLEHVCKVLPFELRIRRILRARVQKVAVRTPNSLYSSNTCAKYSCWISEFVVFLEHVCTFVKYSYVLNWLVAGWLTYFSNTCAKCCRSSCEFAVFLEHVCKVLPFELRIRRIL